MYSLEPVATIHTPFKQKFAIPRQSNLAAAQGQLHFLPGFDDPACFKGLEQYSHLWLIFLFHQNIARGWKPAIKAPRLGGNATMGVFASRSTHRPNHLGMSVVRNEGVVMQSGKPVLNVSGIDLLDQTPIVDIKPYLGYADSHPEAVDGLDQLAPIPQRNVHFTPQAQAQLAAALERHPGLQALLVATLQQDPRPAYRQQLDEDPKEYKVMLYDLDVAWQVRQGHVEVTSLQPAVG